MEEIWKRDEIDSPCVNICVIHETAGICIGCYRTRFEIAGWSRMTSVERANVTEALPERSGLLRQKRRGGRKARRGSE
ncbi:MAG: DUF1289 domain-containing protein [Rhodobacteraceae bacterium]|nr:DUF1289 domain-containing protein [Paracoccaceae bacterium]